MSATAEEVTLAQTVVHAIADVVGPGPVGLHEPHFGGNEWDYVKECIDSSFVSSVGKFVDRFEDDLAALTGAKHAVAVVNGTAALHVALKLAGVQPGDEVLLPALTFIASANAISYCGAVPHFIDSEERTLGAGTQSLRDYLFDITERTAEGTINRKTGRPIRALVPMHTFGHPVDLDGLMAVAEDYGLVLVEDAAESLGSTYQGRHAGTFGKLSALSFNGNKTVTTGGGGAVLTNDPEIARHAKHITTTAKVPHRWEYRHDEIGYNYRMPNINAALGCAQLEQLPKMIEAKRELHDRYARAFAGVSGVALFTEPQQSRSNYWLQAILLDKADPAQREAVLQATNDAGLMTRPVWTLMPELEPYKNCPSMPLGVAKSLEARIINIPSSPQLVWGRS